MSDQQAAEIIIEVNDFGGVYANVPETMAKEKYSEAYLKTLLKKADCFGITFEESVHDEINELISSAQSGRVKIGNKEDAVVDVLIPYDKLTAKLSISTARGGKQAGVQEIMAALDSRNVDLSLVKKKRIVGLILQGRCSEAGSLVEVEIAKGYPPQHGQDTRFESLQGEISERLPSESRDGSLEYRDLEELLSVEEGIQLMRMIPATEPKKGINVIGEEIEAKEGSVHEFSAGDGVAICSKNPNVLISNMKGQILS
jgi:uncharacterized protein (DUF342 family)